VDFVEDDSLVNEAHAEYESRVFRKAKTCTLEIAHDNGVGVFVTLSSSYRVFTCILCSDFFGFVD